MGIKALLLAGCMMMAGWARSQVTSVELQASGLTCSMCSKAVLNALKEVPAVEKVQVNIKNQQYQISFRKDASIQLDALSKAVEDAGFSVASLKVTANLPAITVGKDEHVESGGLYFHFLNGTGQQLQGSTTFTLVDKNFLSAKEFKKYSGLSKKECVQTGRMASCCSRNEAGSDTRIYHAII